VEKDDAVMIYIALWLLVLLFILIPAFRWIGQTRRYEFEHRTSGGVVEFPSYEASRRHAAKKSLANLLGAVGGLWFIFGGIFCGLLALGSMHMRHR
jgi:hypothetical protein